MSTQNKHSRLVGAVLLIMGAVMTVGVAVAPTPSVPEVSAFAPAANVASTNVQLQSVGT